MPPPRMPAPPPSLPARFEGRLGLDDMARHVPLAVRVPAGTEALRVRFDHAPRHPGAGEIPHQLSISVTGPGGCRGTRHNSPDQNVLIGAAAASPGYLPGPIEPGIWLVEIDTHRILAPGRIDWIVEVTAAPAPPAPDPDPAPRPRFAARGGPGWYRGDLHRHTCHSDGLWDPAAMVADARARGYDFAAVTDHNTVSAVPLAQAAAGNDLLIVPGCELTTFHGHALALGSAAMPDWRIRDGQTMAARVDEIAAQGDLFVIAHPMSVGHPFCTGCTWAWADAMPGPVRLVEVWNGPWGPGPKNAMGLDLFRGWLNAGHRLVATAGSDDHGRGARGGGDPGGGDPGGGDPGARPGHMLVHAASLSLADLLAGLARGHAILTRGPVLEVSGTDGAGARVLPGDRVAGAPEVRVRWRGAEAGGRLRLVTGRSGAEAVRVAADLPAGAAGEAAFAAPALAGASWAMVELRDRDHGMQAMANPVFLDPA